MDDFFAEATGDPKPSAAPVRSATKDASRMSAEDETRIRAMPGNNTCQDCDNISPQWASVSYGSLMCLECSGQHRSLGVHLSFVRSIAMDSWTDRQIMAMDKSGGNAALVSYLKSKGIEQNVQIATKYNTKQAAYFKERLSRWLDGKTEPPPDPGNWDPTTGVSDAQGAEPLPGETTEEYNARQARLKEAARERMRAKFGEGGMGGQGMGSPEEPGAADQVGAAASAAAAKSAEAAKAAAGAMGSAFSGGMGYLKTNVIENADLHNKVRSSTSGALDSVKGAAGGAAETAGGVWGSLRKQVAEGDLVDKFKKNATAEEGSAVRQGFGWGLGAATSLWAKASETVGDAISGNQKPCTGEHQLTVNPQPDVKCELCNVKGTRYACGRGCEYFICPKCFEKPPPTASKAGADGDGGWGDFDAEDEKEPPPAPTEDDMARIAKELGMSMGDKEPVPAAEPKPQPKPKAKPLTADDFFAEFD